MSRLNEKPACTTIVIVKANSSFHTRLKWQYLELDFSFGIFVYNQIRKYELILGFFFIANDDESKFNFIFTLLVAASYSIIHTWPLCIELNIYYLYFYHFFLVLFINFESPTAENGIVKYKNLASPYDRVRCEWGEVNRRNKDF